MSSDALVSIIIPVHNRPAQIGEAVASVLAQTYRPLDVIVVDDGSDDETPSALGALARRSPESVRWVRREVCGGPGAAREEGRALARGEFVQYLDSDDRLAPDKLERQVSLLRACPDIDVVYGDVEEHWIGTDGSRRTVRRELPDIATGFPALLAERVWHTFAPLYRRTVVDRAGPWLALWNEEDWEYDARIASLGTRYAHLPGTVGTMVRRPFGHLSGGSPSARARASQAIARPLILRHALSAGIPMESPEFQQAVRSLFLLARQCGAEGLRSESRGLLGRVMSWSRPVVPGDVRMYRQLARLLGWRQAGRLAAWRDARREGRTP